MIKVFIYGFCLFFSFASFSLSAEEDTHSETPLLPEEPLQIVIQGLKGDELKNVEVALSPPIGLVREGKVDRLWIERFKTQIPEKVRQALEPFGYYEVHTEVSLETVKEGIFKLHVDVHPGRPVRVISVNVSIQGPGAKEKRLKDLVNTFPLKVGDVLLHQKYEGAKGNLKTEALNLGYLDAEFSVHVIRVFRKEYRAEIELILETGPRYYFGEIRILGAPEYPERFLRRYVAFRSGEVFSYSKIFQTQINFNNSDRFKEVIVLPEKEKAEGFKVPVQIRLVPSKPKRLRVGLGYGTDTGARMTGNYQDLNFNRWGHEWYVESNLSQRFQNLVSRYVLPSFSDLNSFTSLKGGVEHEQARTYESRAFILEFEHTRSLQRGWLGSGYLRMRREDFEVGREEGRSRLIMPGLRISKRHYDDLTRPRRGYRLAMEVRGTDRFLGSDTGFLQFLANGDLLFPLPFQFILITRGQSGFTLLSDPLSELPPSVRFFAGGDRSIRGYAYQSLGPRDTRGKVIGGKHLLVGTIELERPIWKIIGLAAFYDVGNAFNHFGKIDPQHGAGMGLRVYTPIGPIRFDVGRQIGVKDPEFRIHLTVGFEL